jgi:hypothetical protein
MTIKIIDLLEQFSKNKQYSEKTKIRYYDLLSECENEAQLNRTTIFYLLYNNRIGLCSKVEILDEPNKIKKLKVDGSACMADIMKIQETINKLIDKVNSLDKEDK